MKHTFKAVAFLSTAVVFLYTSCTKTGTKPVATPAVTNEMVSSQVALNIGKSLAGSFGGASIKDGINKSPTVSGQSKLKVNSFAPCGFLIDKGISYATNIGDSIKSTTNGNITYFFSCTDGKATSYTVTDTLVTAGTAPGYIFNYNITQDYDVKGLNTNNSRIELSGLLKAFVDLDYPKDHKKSTSVHNNYVLKNLEINQDDDYDITSGTADFVSKGTNSYGSWDFEGTVTYLGNHRAKIEFAGKLFFVDLKTGTVTAG